jgi:galactokinase
LTQKALLDRAIAGFRSRFGIAPQLAAVAPGRVNLIGEHTDYNDGFVLPFAIDREVIAVAAVHDRPASTVRAIDLDDEVEVDWHARPRNLPRGHWSSYLRGVGQQFLDRGHALPNFDLALTSSIPSGAGLSSSAAIEVAMATLLERMTGLHLDAREKAIICRDAEHAAAGVPCGIMDMLIATTAQDGCAMLIDCRSNMAQPVPLPSNDDAVILVVDTGVRHALASSDYADRRHTCESAARKLGVPSLRDATLTMLASHALTDLERRRSSHVITENTRTLLAASALLQNELETLGALMFESHRSLRDLFEVSCPELDAIVDAAAELRGNAADGVLGARMTGGGFGGCAIVLCRAGASHDAATRIANMMKSRLASPAAIFEATASRAAHAIDLG